MLNHLPRAHPIPTTGMDDTRTANPRGWSRNILPRPCKDDNIVVKLLGGVAVNPHAHFRKGRMLKLVGVRFGHVLDGTVGIVVWEPRHQRGYVLVGVVRRYHLPRVLWHLVMLGDVFGEQIGIIHEDAVGEQRALVELCPRLVETRDERSDHVGRFHLVERSGEDLGVVILSRFGIARNGQRHRRYVICHHVAPMSGRRPPLLEGTLGVGIPSAQYVLPHR
mmetsp:Transcript_2667/g.6167  ORF Transcript_2667/g.6167 Transcript_2667/m.6167 type:complete len:221 (-) Transcript_2667:33-695(-)